MPTSARRGRPRSARVPEPLPDVATAPVLTVLVCHDGAAWLRETLDALAALNRRPRYVLAVDTGSTDDTPELLRAAMDRGLLDGVLTMAADAGFGDAVRHAVERAEDRWGDPGRWLWLLHDDSAPEPACLDVLLTAADASPSVAMLGPLCLDWSDPRLVVEAGLSTDASGHRQTGLGPDELDPTLLGGGLAQNTEVLSVGSAGALVRREVWNQLGGYDPALPMLRDDLDFGWRVNRADHLVLVVPAARIRHAAAATSGERATPALGAVPHRTADRAHGLRTFLVNSSALSYGLGLPRLVLLALLRAVGFALVRRTGAARAELGAVEYLLSGRAGLREARRSRRAAGDLGVRGLLTGRWSRLRAGTRGLLLALMRRRMAADAAIGRLPANSTSWVPPSPAGSTATPAGRMVGPEALPAGVLPAPSRRDLSGRRDAAARPGRPEHRDAAGPGRRDAPGDSAGPGRRRGVAASVAGLRRPGISVVVSAAPPAIEPRTDGTPDPAPDTAPQRQRPSPTPRGQPAPAPELFVVDVGGARLARELLLAPSVLLVAGLVVVAALVHRGRYGLDLSGGRLAPLGGVAETWAFYLADWHPVLGGTSAPAPAALAVFGVLGAILRPLGAGPGAAASLLILGGIPLAGVSAYFATRRLAVPRWGRAVGAAAYALLPVGTAAAVQGRLDGVIAHVLLPAVLAGVAGVLSGWPMGRSVSARRAGARAWLPSACATALGLAVISAFAPLVHVLVLALVLVGFVAVAGPRGQGLRRVVALFAIVLLPLGLLLPWPAVVLQHPSVLLHGTGVVVDEVLLDPRRLFVLDAGGPGPTPWLGALVSVGCLLVVAARPRRAAVPGVAVAVVGFAAAVVVSTLTAVPLPGGGARPGWPGAALLLAGCGLLWAALGAMSSRPGDQRIPGWLRYTVPAGAGVVVVALTAAAVSTGAAGSLTTQRPRLAAPIQAEVTAERTGVLVVDGQRDPVRGAVGRLPAFGDDDLAAVATAPTRMARWAAAFRSGQQPATQSAALEAAVSGFEFVVLPDRAAADVLLAAGGELVTGAPDTTDGRPTVRLLPVSMPAVVLAAQVADRARTGGAPPPEYGREGVVSVPAAPPAVRVMTGPGDEGRALVVAAETEDGWIATVDGDRVATSMAWGHLVAVPLPPDAAEVRLERSATVRTLLLLVQLAVALFTAITAIPSADRRG